jgi:hypothetical protein
MVTEDYTLTEPVGQITLSLMTPCRAEVRRPGQIVLAPPGADESAQVLYDPGRLTATIEVIDVEDGRLRAIWPEKIARILLKADKPPLQDT